MNCETDGSPKAVERPDSRVVKSPSFNLTMVVPSDSKLTSRVLTVNSDLSPGEVPEPLSRAGVTPRTNNSSSMLSTGAFLAR